MPFYTPKHVPQLPEIPDSISIESFMFNERHGRYPLNYSKNPFTCALSGRTYTFHEVRDRVDYLSRALCKEFGFRPDVGTEWDKVIGVFSLNCIDYMTLGWAVHRVGGILTCVNAAYNEHELEYQMKDSGAKAIFTSLPVLNTCRKGVKKAGISDDRIYLLPLPEQVTQGIPGAEAHRTIEHLIEMGKKLDKVPRSDEKWPKGHAKKRCAFLCYSSGTSGLPKGVMISHYNVIANTTQSNVNETPDREAQRQKHKNPHYTETALGLLPMSHIYGLVVGCHVGPYRGDGVIVLPKYDFKLLLQSIQSYKIAMLYLVPPMIIHITNSESICKQYDLSSVRAMFTGAAPLGKETATALLNMYPAWSVRQGYGLTETSTVVSSTLDDIWLGTSGSLLPGVTARLFDPEGQEITSYNTPGELWVKSPAVVLGYLHNEAATKETFIDLEDGRYMRTGDEAIFAVSEAGIEHLTITDRIKELIKVKGLQVAPAELEAHLLTHPAVSDCVVIGVPSDREGEVPKAFVVRAPGAIEDSEALIKRDIKRHVEQHKSSHKWLKGGVEFIDVVPKSPSGKILRRLVRDQEREKMRKQGAKL